MPDLLVQLDYAARRRYGEQLYRQLRDVVLTGRLGPGARLPASRSLAATLGVAVVAFAPFVVRRWLPVGLGLLLAVTLGLLDLAAPVKFVAPAFPLR